MPNCPNCHQLIDSQATTCPYCRKVLKAYGHPGIPLHRASGEEPLCNSCTYHEDDTCTFPQRPYARECTLYSDRNKQQVEALPRPSLSKSIRLWCQRNQALLILLAVGIVCFLLALRGTSK